MSLHALKRIGMGGALVAADLVFGLRADLMADTETFSEYRLRGTNDGRNELAAQGVRGSYEVLPGLTLAPSLERVGLRNAVERVCQIFQRLDRGVSGNRQHPA